MGNKLATASNEVCPFLKKSFEDCFCTRLGSQDIPMVLKYCCGTFLLCEIYQKRKRRQAGDTYE